MSLELDNAPVSKAPLLPAWARTFYWSVRRELWEHRSIWMGPLTAGALALTGYLIGVVVGAGSLARRAHEADLFTAAKNVASIRMPYNLAATAVTLTSFAVAFFYCLGALNGERRDRSILFWKSLPVSDRTTVLSKAAVPLFILPVIVLALTVVIHLLMAAGAGLVVLANGLDPRLLWANARMIYSWSVLVYGLVFLTFWYAPIYAWLLLVSAWAKRLPVLWAVGPVLAFVMLEHLIQPKGPHAILALLKNRTVGGVTMPMTRYGQGKVWIHKFSDLDPAWLYARPEVWIGLFLAAMFLAAAIQLRRSRDPI